MDPDGVTYQIHLCGLTVTITQLLAGAAVRRGDGRNSPKLRHHTTPRIPMQCPRVPLQIPYGRRCRAGPFKGSRRGNVRGTISLTRFRAYYLKADVFRTDFGLRVWCIVI
jgi:hypothetical protein